MLGDKLIFEGIYLNGKRIVKKDNVKKYKKYFMD